MQNLANGLHVVVVPGEGVVVAPDAVVVVVGAPVVVGLFGSRIQLSSGATELPRISHHL